MHGIRGAACLSTSWSSTTCIQDLRGLSATSHPGPRPQEREGFGLGCNYMPITCNYMGITCLLIPRYLHANYILAAVEIAPRLADSSN